MSEPGFNAFGIVYLLVAVSVVLLVAGLVMRRRGALRSRGAAIGWAVLTVLPLVIAGLAFRGKHVAEDATGTEVVEPSGRPGLPADEQAEGAAAASDINNAALSSPRPNTLEPGDLTNSTTDVGGGAAVDKAPTGQ
ncbi:hypothetical protein [Sphingomonas jatrophae]|uniref:Uncharacterized protein n=1 Tax=Sphingomonas jatrophae TaxID=1166337 RepID=A0A1I6LD83_9SPHN|nr:hypothetical protein [Sphingomonas jatrophae]SFS01393.1 hypothetical protein SAMN05192580_2595 [Sphingomonas jatrophae]